MKGFKYQFTLKKLLKKYKPNGEIDSVTILLPSAICMINRTQLKFKNH